MRTVKVFIPPGTDETVPGFLNTLDERLREKLLWQIFRLSNAPLCSLKEPHFKHFALEKYNRLYELREKNRILVRIIFTVLDGDILLLAAFVKRQPRDTEKALERSLRMLAEAREHPEFAVNLNFHTKEDAK